MILILALSMFTILYESNHDWQRRAKKRLEKIRIIIDDRKKPIERIKNAPQNFEQLIKILPILTDNKHMFFSKRIMKDLDKFIQAVLIQERLDIIELI